MKIKNFILRKKFFLITVFIFIFIKVHSQKEGNIWYFGGQAGLDFNSSTPLALTNGTLFSYDCSAATADINGSILFYTNGMEVWNSNHVTMSNGSGLLGSNNGGQVALIVPQPNSLFYYIFTVDQFAGTNGFRYHIVDMSQNGGLGAVTSKNNLLFSPSTERIDAVYNCFDNSYWVVTHEWNSDKFNSYKITSSGLITTPVSSLVGAIHSGGATGVYNSLGQLTISPLGNKLVCGIYSMGFFQLFDFDISTGIISNPLTISGYSNAWGAAFSPDGTRLYITQWFGTNIIQFDLTAGSISAIMASATVVGIVSGPGTSGYYVGYLQLAPDNKIYAAVYDDQYIAVINNPDTLGLNCNFVDTGAYLGGKQCKAGLCRTIPICETTGIENYQFENSISVYPVPSGDFIHVGFPKANSYGFYIVRDATGRIIVSGIIAALKNSLEVDIQTLTAGIYFLEIKFQEKYLCEKFVKM